MDLDAAADELYGVAPEEFLETRVRLVAAARQVKDRELAKQIGQLRKPTRTGWLVNVLSRAEPDRVTELLDLGPALADAQQRGSGTDLRRLSAERRSLVDALARRTLELGRDRGYQAPDAAHQEVAQTLQSALGDPAVAELLRSGRLTQAATYGGFGMADPGPALTLVAPSAEPVAEPEPEVDVEAEAAAEAERLRASAAAEAEAALDRARAALAAGVEESERATAEADRLADEIESLRSRLTETEAAEQAGRAAARAARKQLTELRSHVEEAERAWQEVGG